MGELVGKLILTPTIEDLAWYVDIEETICYSISTGFTYGSSFIKKSIRRCIKDWVENQSVGDVYAWTGLSVNTKSSYNQANIDANIMNAAYRTFLVFENTSDVSAFVVCHQDDLVNWGWLPRASCLSVVRQAGFSI